MPLTIRRATTEDASEMVVVRREAILSKSTGHYPQAILDAWAAERAQTRVLSYEQEIADPNTVALVAEADGTIIGFATALPAKGELCAVYVKRNRLGRVGRALLDALEKRIFKVAASITCVAALGAVRFYRANGYADEGPVNYVDTFGVPVPCVRMRKTRANEGQKLGRVSITQ
jgi:hypothetical protein